MIPEKTLAHVSSDEDGARSGPELQESKGAFETVVSKPEREYFCRALIQEMQARWAAGDRPLCDEYLEKLPDSSEKSDSAVDLIYSEYLLRKQYGLDASVEMLANRFPEYSDAIQRQLELEDLVLQTQATPGAMNGPWSQNHPLIDNREFPVTVGRYLLLSPLGTGGQADVYLGMHPVLHRQVVIKISKSRLDRCSSAAENLLHEGRILASLDHPNLVRVHDVDVVDGFPVVVMDYVRGKSLEDYANFKKLTDREIRSVMQAIAKAVDYIHQQDLLHLDIKPRNIIIDEQGVPRLIDFGIAQLDNAWAPNGQHHQMSGTLQYMAPEQVPNGKVKLGRYTDIYALGGVLYFLLTRLAPIRAETFHSLVEKVKRGHWDRDALTREKPNRRFILACSRALAFEPQERFASAQEFASALQSSQRTRLAVVVCGLLFGCLAALALWQRQRVDSPLVALTPHVPLSETAGSNWPELVVSIWNGGRFERIEDRLPLVNKDELNLRVTLPPKMEGALLHFDVEHGGQTLAKWNATDEEQVLYVPDRLSVLPLQGARSVQILLLCAAMRIEPVVEELKSLNAIEQGSELPEYSLVHLDAAGVRLVDQGRGFGLPIPIEQATGKRSVEDLMRQFRSIADRHQGMVTGVAFLKK